MRNALAVDAMAGRAELKVGLSPGSTMAKLRGNRWFAWLREQARWVEIPHEVILREVNPSAEKAHLCWAYDRVLCFLPPYPDG